MSDERDQICEVFDPPPGCHWEKRDGLSGWYNPKEPRTEYYPYGETVKHRHRLHIIKYVEKQS